MSVRDKQRVPKKRRWEIPVPLEIETEADIVPPRYFAWKGILDRGAAALLLLPGLPMIGALVLLVRLTSRGPGLFRQSRVGKGGRVFTMYKIRTMKDNAETGTGPVWTRAGDPRVTRLGKILRKLHLDELPQLFNVLRGEMSLIGPRPERPEFVKLLAKEIPGYVNRLAVPPGVTGLAQINLPPDTDLDSVRRKLALDLDYIRNASLLLDFRMFLCTLVRLLGLPCDGVMMILRLRRQVDVHEPGLHGNGAGGGQSVPLTSLETGAREEEGREIRDQSHKGNGHRGPGSGESRPAKDASARTKPR